MPGFTFVEYNHPEQQSSNLLEALKATCFDERYSTELVLERDQKQLAVTRYPNYPVNVLESRKHWIFLEGIVYNKTTPQLWSTLSALASCIFSSRLSNLRRRLAQLDGEFVAFFLNKKTEKWAVVNDMLGRLPLYHRIATNAFYLTREFRVFNHLSSQPDFDRLGMAQQLMFRYPLGTRTLLDGVRRLPPATLILSSSGSPPDFVSLHTLNLEDPAHTNRSLRENAQELATRFKACCMARGRRAPHCAVALSGGLDSRAVTLGLHATNQPFETVTFARHDGANRRDVDGAAALADEFNFDAHTLSLSPTTGDHLLQLLRAKGGLNLLNLGHVAHFLEELLWKYDDSLYLLTGDGGPVLKYKRPPDKELDEESLLYRVLQSSWFDPHIVSQLTGIPKQDLVDSIRHRLHDYPENDLIQKYIHFSYERIYKFAFEGEDRNRYYCWSSAPLLSWPFARYAIHCPDQQKTNFHLYRAFLHELSPNSLNVGYSDFLGIRMTSARIKLYMMARSVIRSIPSVKKFLHRMLGRRSTYAPDAAVLTCMRQQMERCPEIGDYLDINTIDEILSRSGEYPRHHIDNLFTLTSVTEARHRTSSLNDYRNVPIGQ